MQHVIKPIVFPKFYTDKSLSRVREDSADSSATR